MNFNSLVSRLYMSFSILIVLMLGSAWFAINGNQTITSKIQIITQESTPLMVSSAELTIDFLNINRSLTPFFSAMYIDELESLKADIHSNIDQYKQRQIALSALADHDLVVSQLIEAVQTTDLQAEQEIDTVLAQYANYLDKKDRDLYQQSQFQSLASQLNSHLINALTRAETSSQTRAIEGLLSQVGILIGEVSEVFSLQDMIELRAVERRFENRQRYFNEAVAAYKTAAPNLHRQGERTLDLLAAQAFTEKGAVREHVITVELYESFRAQRSELEQLIDQQLVNIDALSDYALDTAQSLYTQSYDQSRNLLIALIATSVVSILFAVFIAISSANRIRRPSKQLQSALARVAEKDLTANIDNMARNEFGLVGQKVNLVIEHLSHIIVQMRSSSHALNRASLDNQSTSEALNTSISEQTNQTLQVATAMEQIECSVSEIASSANLTLEMVTDAVENSAQGQQVMNQNIQLLNTLSEEMDNATNTIHELEKETASIESILDVISLISEQTNLLALNAAIEAARAGEHGRGFSVVADEVRMLAAKTTTSTQEIQSKIEQLQSRSKLAVQQIVQCTDGVSRCVSQTSEVGQSLSQVHQRLNQIEDSSHQIAASTTEHQSVASEVTQNVSHIHDLAQRNLSRSQALATHGEQLEIMAEKQAELTASFKLTDIADR